MDFLSLENVCFTYPKRTEQVIKGITFSVKLGETVALMGPNGSGKTTIGKLMVKIYKPTSGRILIDGRDIMSYSLSDIGCKIGYVFQNPEKQLFSPTVKEEISFGLRFRGVKEDRLIEKVDEMLSYFDLGHRADNFPFNLSQGEKQRLAIASVLALEPKFIIFDEPTTGLDYLRKKRFLEILCKVRDKGVGYMMISHDYDFCKSCTQRVLYIEEGKLA